MVKVEGSCISLEFDPGDRQFPIDLLQLAGAQEKLIEGNELLHKITRVDVENREEGTMYLTVNTKNTKEKIFTTPEMKKRKEGRKALGQNKAHPKSKIPRSQEPCLDDVCATPYCMGSREGES